MIHGLILECPPCGHQWYWNPGPLQVDALVARMKGERVCPKCGNSSRAQGNGIVIMGDKNLKEAAQKLGVPWVEDTPLSAKEIAEAKALCEPLLGIVLYVRGLDLFNSTAAEDGELEVVIEAFGGDLVATVPTAILLSENGGIVSTERTKLAESLAAALVCAANMFPRALADLELARELLQQTYLFPIYDTGCRFCGARLKQGQIHEERCLGEIVRAYLASAEEGKCPPST